VKLYKLKTRCGQVKKRLVPWFAPPAAGAPQKYAGWIWSPEDNDWLATPMTPFLIHFGYQRAPEPDYIPVRALPYKVPGWQWSDSMQGWYEVPIPGAGHYETGPYPTKPDWVPSTGKPSVVPGWEYNFDGFVWVMNYQDLPQVWIPDPHPAEPDWVPTEGTPDRTTDWYWSWRYEKWAMIIKPVPEIEVTPPRSLPPGFVVAGGLVPLPVEEEWERFLRSLLAAGFTPAEAGRVSDSMKLFYQSVVRAQRTGTMNEAWRYYINNHLLGLDKTITQIGGAAVVVAVVAAVGFLIGSVLQRILMPSVKRVYMGPAVETYLIEGGGWSYSRAIGTSPKGRQFYSMCGDIGTSLLRFKREKGGGLTDRIDFPGGFVQSGFKFPYYVKYTWDYWDLKFVGVTKAAGSQFYVLRQCHEDTTAFQPGQMLESDKWCYDFEYYL